MTDEEADPNFLATVLSTITRPLPLDVIIVYDEIDLDRVPRGPPEKIYTTEVSPKAKTKNVLHHQERFRLFREMYRVREFQLVLCADVHGCIDERAMRTLGDIVVAEKAKGGLDYLRREPLIICEERVPRLRFVDWPAGDTPKYAVYASAL